eukprot:4853993-Prymnesium_polylepis.1
MHERAAKACTSGTLVIRGRTHQSQLCLEALFVCNFFELRLFCCRLLLAVEHVRQNFAGRVR